MSLGRHCGQACVPHLPAGACEACVMTFSGALHCAGASNSGLLVPGACASVCLCLVRACIFALKCQTRLRRATHCRQPRQRQAHAVWPRWRLKQSSMRRAAEEEEAAASRGGRALGHPNLTSRRRPDPSAVGNFGRAQRRAAVRIHLAAGEETRHTSETQACRDALPPPSSAANATTKKHRNVATSHASTHSHPEQGIREARMLGDAPIADGDGDTHEKPKQGGREGENEEADTTFADRAC